jgi:cytochrome c553
MLNRFFSTVFGAGVMFALAAVPAGAADEVETKLQVCSSCHGENGEPIDATIPIIWGQQQSYLVKQIHDYKSGDRENPIMSAMLESIKQQEIRKASAYFSAKTWPARHAADAAVAATVPAANTAAAVPNGTTVCRICHQANFEGGPPAPRLAGQKYEYLLQAMNSFANEERTNSVDMMKLMKALTPGEREAIARYLAAL